MYVPSHASIDSPKCLGNLTTTNIPLGFNLTWSGHSGLLPVTYNISVVSQSSEVVVSTSNVSHKTLDLRETDYNWQSNTTYFVSVTACTSAGCSRDCSNTTIRTGGVLVICECVCLHVCVCVCVCVRVCVCVCVLPLSLYMRQFLRM